MGPPERASILMVVSIGLGLLLFLTMLDVLTFGLTM
jgi:hypothetical protein